MSPVLKPWQLWVVALAGWINEQQQQVIQLLKTENRVLWETHGKKRIFLNHDQRRRLAVKSKVLGRKLLQKVATIVAPDTLPRWYRQLIAQKWGYSSRRKKKPGRPATCEEVVQLVLGMARENLAAPPAHGLAWVAEPTNQTFLNDSWFTSPTSDFTALIDN